jgi:DNA replication protein DnaC
VLFATAIDVVNTLSAAQLKGTLKTELRRYTTPALLVLDEVGYLSACRIELPLVQHQTF